MKSMCLPSGDQSSPSASVAKDVTFRGKVTVPWAESNSATQTCDPPSFVERNREALPIRRPSRTVAVLIGDEHALGGSRVSQIRRDVEHPTFFLVTTFFFTSCRGHDPDMRRLR